MLATVVGEVGQKCPLGNLSDTHLAMLRSESSISDEVIRARGYRTVADVKELIDLGFSNRQLRVPGLLLPLHTTDGNQLSCIYRPDNPGIRDGKPAKYEMLAKQGMRLDCPPSCRLLLADPSIALWLTEGQKKGDSFASRGACAVALLGVDCFKGKNPFGGITFLNDWDYIALNGREVRIVFDSDVMRKSEVRKALERLTEHLQRKGAHVSAVYLPAENGKKCGVDDYLAAGHTLADLEALTEGPRPQLQAAPPLTELLDTTPLCMSRPLTLINGRAYAAVWPYVKITKSETLDKEGNVVKLNPPAVTTEQRLLIVRDDGCIFGNGGDAPLSETGMEIKLDTRPPDDRLWQTTSVKAYCAGARPDPKDVFTRVTAVYDHYLDFSRSLVSQEQMCDFSACLSFMTWFIEAFDVLPYPWPNGDWGSGKTEWATIWASTSFLGQVLILGGSFAALRDLADQGAAMMFDDAENVNDPKTDPDKRALLLAGNRRGAMVPLKEPAGDRTWKIRWINAFCPRGFTAKKKPIGALETRSLLIPLIKTADRVRGNRDPARIEGWPHAWRQLQDDLWATALMLLSEAKKVWAEFDNETTLVGRNFEPWRAPVAIARLLEKHGVTDLEKTLREVMAAYTQEKVDAPQTYETKVVEAIGVLTFGPSEQWKSSDMLDMSDVSDNIREIGFTAQEVVQQVKDLAAPDEDTEWATTQRIGLILNSLRIPKKRDPSTKKRERLRIVTRKTVSDILQAYGILSRDMSDLSKSSDMSDEKEPDVSPEDPQPRADTQHNHGSHGGNGTRSTAPPETDSSSSEEEQSADAEVF